MTPMTAGHWRELARRTGSGVEVALLWNQSAGRVKVAVSDRTLCHHVDLEPAGADAVSAFLGPFAQASNLLATAPLMIDEDRGMH